MTEFSNLSFCCFCKHEFRDGEGRYRLLQQGEQVECCPGCFDGLRTFAGYPFEAPSKNNRHSKQKNSFSTG